MFRRLLALLLLFALGTPALAMTGHCLPPPAPMAAAMATGVTAGLSAEASGMTALHDHAGMDHGSKHKAPSDATARQDCIGCVAPLHGSAPLATPQVWRAQLLAPRTVVRFDATALPPEIPPPRS